MSNPKIKYSKQRNGEIFYPRTVAEAIRFKDGESLETKMNKEDSAKNYPIASELEAREGVSNDVLMTPLRTLQLLEENGMNSGGGGITIPVLSSEYNQTSVDTGTSISIPITFYSPNLGKGTLHLLVDGVEVSNTQIAQGSSYAEFGVLEKGNHRLSIFVVDRGGIYTDTLSFNIKVGALDISSTFDDSTDFTITQVIKIPLTVDTISLDPVYATYTIDGTATRISVGTGYNIIQLPVLSPGAHKVVITAESGVYKSNTLSFNIIIEDADNLVVISDFNATEITYRNLMELQYRVSLKGVTKFVAKYYDNDTLLKTLNIPAGTNIWSTRELEIGAHTLKIVVTTEDGSMSAELVRELTVIESDYKPMSSVVDASLIAWFDATGKTNSDSDKEIWLDKSPASEHPTVDFYNVNYNTNGWIDNALKLNGGAYAVINMQPLTEITNAGLTVDIRYRTRDVGFQNACVLDMRGSDTSHKGFAIDTEKIYLNSASNSLSSDVIQEEISRATFVIDPYNKITKIYNNGVLTETFLMSDNEDFYTDSKIYLGTRLEESNGTWIPNVFGDCEIYSIRVYTRALESEEIVQNHIADIVDLIEQQEKYELNYQNNMPTMYFYGDTSAMTKDSKVPLRIKYISTDPSKYGESFDLVDCLVSWQGTSSLQYAVKNYKIRLKRQDGTKFKYNPYPNGIEESTFCLKADYMESSHANNTGMAKFINDQLYDTPTPPQVTNEDVRTTINGFPIQLYIAKNENVEPTYIGVFNFNLDKSCNSSFGLNNEVEGFENCVRFEVSSNSDTSAGAFRDDSDESMREDFELNYPDPDDLTTEQQDSYYNSLKRVVTWVKNSTEETFEAELEQYFNKEYLIKYFLQVHLFGMIDNFGKNMMLATWDGNIWYPMFYDLDSQLGLDNTGYKKFMSDIDIVEGVYNTSNSKLFTMLQTCFADEIAETYKTLRRTGKYSMSTILSYWYGEQVAKIGELQYNKDMEAKYIAFKNDYLFMLHGRRYEHMKKWLSERMLYLDTIYGYEEDTSASITIRANTLNTITFKILTYSPQYLKVKWRNGIEQVLKVGRDASGNMTPATFSGTVAAATDQEIIIYNAKQIKTIEGLASANPSVLNLVEASRLISVDCQKATVLTDVRLSSNNKFLSYLNLNGCSKYGDEASGGSSSLDLSYLPYMTYVNLNGTKLTNVNFPTNGCNLKSLYIDISTLKALILENMPILRTLSVSDRAGLSTFRVVNCPQAVLNTNEAADAWYSTSLIVENIYISGSPNLVNNGSDIVAFNTTRNLGHQVPFIPITNCYIKDLIGIKTLKIRFALNSAVTPTLKSLAIDVDAENIQLYGVGFEEQVEELDINLNKVQRFLMKKYMNIKNINLTSNLKGVHIANLGTKSNYYDMTWSQTHGGGGTYTTTQFNDFAPFETLTMDGELVEDVLDFSNNPKLDILWFDDLPNNINTVKLNCDFTEVFPYIHRDGLADYFKLPTRCYVEGYLKSSNYAIEWCKATSTEYPVQENFDNLEWDLSKVTELKSIFRYWKNLKTLPDSLTPEVINNATSLSYAFADCTSLQSINRLEGGNLKIKNPQLMFENCGDKNYSATLGNLEIECATQDDSKMFNNSFFRSIGNVTINNTCPHTTRGETFKSMKNLESFGLLTITGINTFTLNNLFNSCSKLSTFGGINLEFSNDMPNPIGLAGTFFGCKLSDYLSVIKPLENYPCSLPNCFGYTSISSLEGFETIIKNATNVSEAFKNTNITSVPDLEINGDCSNMFNGCLNLKTVGSIVINGRVSSDGVFSGCTKLTSIDKFDAKDAKRVAETFSRCSNLTRIGYLDISYFTRDASAYPSTYTQTFLEAKKLTSINFEGTIGKCLATTLMRINNCPIDYDSLVDLINCLEPLTTTVSLGLHSSTFALLTEELLAIATGKNWTITG